jgi:hypothetical protein
MVMPEWSFHRMCQLLLPPTLARFAWYVIIVGGVFATVALFVDATIIGLPAGAVLGAAGIMNASSSVLGLIAVTGIMVIAAFGTRNRTRPIRGEVATRVTWILLAVGAVTVVAAIGVFVSILSSS